MRAPWRRPASGGPPTLLVDHWYSPSVGSVIRALRRCQGYRACDPELRVSLVLNRASPTELAACAPFVHEIFAVPYTSFGAPAGSPRRALQRVPRNWDHVVHHPAATDPGEQRFEGMRRYYEAATRHFRGRLTVGIAGRPPPGYAPHQELRLALPPEARERARVELDGSRAIAVMPAGSGAGYLYPSITSWLLILAALEARFPEVVFVLVGRVGTGARMPSRVGGVEVDRLRAAQRQTIDAFDRPILEQLALVEASSVLLSPHTDFGFAAVAVGTPCLTLAGGEPREELFNGVPFHSVLPKSIEDHAFTPGGSLPMVDDDSDGEGPRATTMSVARVEADLDELVDAAEALAAGRISYESALADHFARLVEAFGGDRARIRSFEDVHLPYL
jgi:hypothetical protein